MFDNRRTPAQYNLEFIVEGCLWCMHYNIHIARFIQMSIGKDLRMQKIRFYFSHSFKDHDFKEKNLIGRNKSFQSATNTKHIIIF